MSEKETGGPAFPIGDTARIDECGMTLRDYFAAKALQGYMANPTSFGPDVPIEATTNPIKVAEICAAFSYMVADSMLKERNK